MFFVKSGVVLVMLFDSFSTCNEDIREGRFASIKKRSAQSQNESTLDL